MKRSILIILGKIIAWIGKRLGRGSTLPGQIILKFEPDMLKKLELPNHIIAVTGSSGKGSITKVIATILRQDGYTVAHNESGSNLEAGILTMLLHEATIKGKIKADYLVCEVDERYTKFVFPKIHPQYVVVTNITRDQPPRQGHFDKVFTEIEKALDENMHLILNADDPYLQKFENHGCKITYYGIGKNRYSSTTSKYENLNISHCPICHKKLQYHYYQFEALGDYYCSCNQFQRPTPQYEATNLNLEKSKMTINKKYEMYLKPTLLYNAYNMLACYTLLACLGKKEKQIVEQLTEISRHASKENFFTVGKRHVHVLNNKNENSTTFNQSIAYTTRFKDEKTIVIGWKEISRRYQYEDLSWLYDIDFELLNHPTLEKVVCVGINRYDIATRMKYAGIDEKKIVVFENLEEAVFYLNHRTKKDIFAILNFDYVKPFSKLMKGSDKHGN